jgi:hypothetical protein
MNDDEKNLDAGFNREFEELGEHAVRRRLGDFIPGKRPMAADWLDRKTAERETRLAEQQTTRNWWARGLAIAAMVVAIAVPLLTTWLFRGK